MSANTITVRVPADLLERARNAAFALRQETLTDMLVRGLEREVAELQRHRHNGEPFPPRTGRLRRGTHARSPGGTP